MKEKLNSSGGCFDRCDDEPVSNEYASPPCYMHEVDPAYFGLTFPTELMLGRTSRDPGFFVSAFVKMRALQDKMIITLWKLRSRMRAIRPSIEKHPAPQNEQSEARPKTSG